MGITDLGEGSARGTRIFFPAEMEGLLEYDLLTGRRIRVLKGHIGDGVLCCTAAPHDMRVFSGGADCVINAWTPPPHGLMRPAPKESPATGDKQLVPAIEAMPAGLLDSNRTASLDDVDAWSDDEDDDRPAPSAWGPSSSSTTLAARSGSRAADAAQKRARHR